MTKQSRLALLALAVVMTVMVLGGMSYKWLVLDPVQQGSEQTVEFVIPKGQSVSKIGQRLTEAGLIRHPYVFRLVVLQHNLGDKLQAGSFELSSAMKPAEIAQKLTQGTQDVWVTILEGWRREEIADYLANQELAAFDETDFLSRTSEVEGKLFPDTYLVPREITAAGMNSLLQDTFEQKVTTGLAKEMAEFTAASGLTFDQVLVLASLVQREARTYEQMRHVAGILLHRLDIGMALQVDASLQYVKGYNAREQSWWTPPLAADKELKSPFNTYLNPGLPPQPIANPGMDAIRAVLNPVETTDIFYLHAPDGTMYYAKTLEEHTVNVNRYLR